MNGPDEIKFIVVHECVCLYRIVERFFRDMSKRKRNKYITVLSTIVAIDCISCYAQRKLVHLHHKNLE